MKTSKTFALSLTEDDACLADIPLGPARQFKSDNHPRKGRICEPDPEARDGEDLVQYRRGSVKSPSKKPGESEAGQQPHRPGAAAQEPVAPAEQRLQEVHGPQSTSDVTR